MDEEKMNALPTWPSEKYKNQSEQEFRDLMDWMTEVAKIRRHFPIRPAVLASYYKWFYEKAPPKNQSRKPFGRTPNTVDHAMRGIGAIHYHNGCNDPNHHPLVNKAMKEIKDKAKTNPLDAPKPAQGFLDAEILDIGDICLRAVSGQDPEAPFLVRTHLRILWGCNNTLRGYAPIAHAVIGECGVENIPNKEGELETCFYWYEKMFKKKKILQKRKRIIRPNIIPAMNFMLFFGLYCIYFDLNESSTGFVFRAINSDGSAPIGYGTLREDGERFRKFGITDERLITKLKRLHATRVTSVVRIFAGGGSLAEAAWAGSWADVKQAIMYALRALESGGRQIGRDASSFFNDESRCIAASAHHSLMKQNRVIQDNNDKLLIEVRELKMQMKRSEQELREKNLRIQQLESLVNSSSM